MHSSSLLVYLLAVLCKTRPTLTTLHRALAHTALQVISDLLKPDKVNLMIREDRRRGVFVDGLSEWVVRSPGEVYGLMMRGAQQVTTDSPPTRWLGMDNCFVNGMHRQD